MFFTRYTALIPGKTNQKGVDIGGSRAQGGVAAQVALWRQSRYAVRAETITELILERAGPVLFKTFYWNLWL